MTLALRTICLYLVLGILGLVWADSGEDAALKKKTFRPVISSHKLEDGRIVERLDLAIHADVINEDHIPATPEAWLSRMLDPTRNGLVLKQPKLFAQWLDAVTEPRFMTALATMAMDPNSYPRTLNRLIDPATARNWAELIDPEVFMRWVVAGMDPALYQTVFQHMFDPNKYLRWATSPRNQSVADTATREVNLNEQDGRHRSGSDAVMAAETWRQLPAGDLPANPWLSHRNTYRY